MNFSSATLKHNFTKVSVVASLALMATGCIVDPDAFDPRPSILNGDAAVALSGTWTVNGAPASAESCGEAGITRVRLTIFDPNSNDTYTDGNFEADCTAGTWSFLLALRQEVFRARWEGLNGNGQVVSTGQISDLNGVGQTALVLPAQNFTNNVSAGFDPTTNGDVEIAGMWTLNSVAPTAQACADTTVQSVRVVVKNDAGAEYRGAALTFPCAQGSFNLPNGLRMGSYESKWEAVSTTGAVLTSSEYMALRIDGQSMATLATPDFILDAVIPDDTLSINVNWESGLGTGVFGGCDQGVSTWDYVFSGPSGEESMNGIACGTGIDSPALSPGDYTMSVVGYQADGSRGWEGTCVGLNVVAGSGTVQVNCDIPAIIGLVVNLAWESTPGVAGTCAGLASAPTFNWELYPMTGNPDEPAIAEAMNIGCTDTLTPSLPEGITAGTYILGINASAGDGTKWGTGTMCVVDLDRGIETFNCTVFLVE